VSSRLKWSFAAVAVTSLFLGEPAAAFDYIEHSYLTDRACTFTQVQLGKTAPMSPELAARYLALSLTCPARWDKPYCSRGYKQLEAGLNRLDEPPERSGDYAITLGDFSALADHLSAFGPVRGLPQASEAGLLRRTLLWLGSNGDAGGVESDVAEDGCETLRPLDWAQLDASLPWEGKRAPPDPAWLSALPRAQAERVVDDPSGAYSFDNPHYLDLVRRNYSHFNPLSHDQFLGFHATARRMTGSTCEALWGLDEGDTQFLAEGLGLDKPSGCDALAERIRLRLLEWKRLATPSLVEPVRRELELLAGPPSPERSALLARVSPALMSLVFEGAGVHFLQDGFSGGHVRLQRSAENLEDSRVWHDQDGENGVLSYVGTERGREVFWLYGDGFLLGQAVGGSVRCAPTPLGTARSPEELTTCLLEAQRARVYSASAASLLDWALIGGPHDDPAQDAPRRCTEDSPLARFVCDELPTSAPSVRPPAPATALPRAGTLPLPPPPFHYQSFLVTTSLDAAGGPPQLGVRTVFLSRLGVRANWMTSYHLGVLTRLGAGPTSEVLTEFSFMFHWRWAARFLVNAGPFAYFGFRDFTGTVSPFFGIGPNVGISVLPEGWISLPLELTLSYRAPLRLLDGQDGFRAVNGRRLEAHWIELSVGLAFMH
jgi:hypothetical protein